MVSPMEYRRLGSSGMYVSEISYGNWITHGSQVEAEAAIKCVRTAYDLGITTFDTADVYAATKAAVSSITRSTAREWAKDKIRVNCIEPSVIKTDFTKTLWGEPHRSKWFDETTPIGRLSTPNEIIGTVIFLATDASSYITGQSVVIDGGILSGGDWDSYA